MKTPKRGKYYYNPPAAVKRIFDNFIWDSPCGKILLTFDDGPNPATTPKILRLLDDASTKALFFTVGENLEKYESLAKEILSAGHLLGNHTQSHSVLTRLNKNEQINAVETVQNFALEKLNYEIKFFRPPHGKFPFSLARTLAPFGITNVMWSLLTYDYENNFNIVKFAIDNYLLENSIVVFHDSDKSAGIIGQSLEYFFNEINRKGFEIENPDVCLKRFLQ